MKVKFIVKGENPQPLWESDLLDIPFKKGDILDITAFRYFKTKSNVERECFPPFNGIFEITDIVHRLAFALASYQNTTYNGCIIYLKRQ